LSVRSARCPAVRAVEQRDGLLLVELDDADRDAPALVRELVAAGAKVQRVAEADALLEQAYLTIVSEAVEGAGSVDGRAVGCMPDHVGGRSTSEGRCPVIGRILAILGKELDELRHSRLIVSTLVVPSLLYVALPLWLLPERPDERVLGTDALTPRELELLRQSLPQLAGLPAERVTRGVPGEPGARALHAGAAVHPADDRQLQHHRREAAPQPGALLATPIRTWELLVAKGLGAALPGTARDLGQLPGLRARRPVAGRRVAVPVHHHADLAARVRAGRAAVRPGRGRASRSSPRRARTTPAPPSSSERWSSCPSPGCCSPRCSGVVLLDVRLMLLVALVALLADLALLWLAVRLFDREAILTRWR
jgi:hypothetical protein